jgi:hypothetical protein
VSITTVRTVALATGTPAVFAHPGRDFAPVIITELSFGEVALVTPLDGADARYVRHADLITHADYPHTPGTLHDCYACLATCHCDDATCVSCDEEQSYGHEGMNELDFDMDCVPDTDIFQGLEDW